MSQELISRIRKSREFRIPLKEGRCLVARRPTDIEMVNAQGKPFHELGASHVIGWEKWTEDDVVGGGGSDAVEFSAGLWAEIYADRPDLWEPVSKAIIDAYQQHATLLKERTKN